MGSERDERSHKLDLVGCMKEKNEKGDGFATSNTIY
jgi:hypothetical protein